MGVEERFWSKVDIPSLYGCWEWQGYSFDGYGRFMIDGTREYDRIRRTA